MRNVYYTKVNCCSNWSLIAKNLLRTVIDEERVELKKQIPIKVHFGERGNITYIDPKNYDGIIDLLEENDIETSFIETNVLYVGSRTVKTDHLKVAKEHGFTRVPVIIADGEYGEEYDTIEINKDFFKETFIGKGFSEFDQFIVCSHFKGHHMAGFGGAIKQLSMGFASRGGKMAQHATSIPKIDLKKCVACLICEDNCPVDAITVTEYAVIDSNLCIGCAGCISHCSEKAINPDWNTQTHFYEKVAEYAYAAQKGKSNIYISFVTNITENCDCFGIEMEPVVNDIGILASTDPVALDQACYDLVIKNKDNEKNSMWSYIDKGTITLKHAEKIGLGTRKYKLIEKA